MGSAFESEVYAERQRLPGVAIDLAQLMRYALFAGVNPATVHLTMQYRPDVETSEWWVLAWGEGPTAASVGATRFDLCLFRAAVALRRSDERAKRYAGQGGRR